MPFVVRKESKNLAAPLVPNVAGSVADKLQTLVAVVEGEVPVFCRSLRAAVRVISGAVVTLGLVGQALARRAV